VEKQLRTICGERLNRFSAVDAKRVEEANGEWEFVNGQLKLTVDDKTMNNIRMKQRFYHHEMDNWAHVACNYSHISIWSQMVFDETVKEDDVWVIFEDDIVVCHLQWFSDLKEVILEMKENGINVFMMDVMRREPEPPIKETEKTKYLAEIRKFWGAHAYFLTKAGAKGLLKYLTDVCESKLKEQTDAIIYQANAKHFIKAGVMRKKYKWFRQDEKQFGTDVQIVYHSKLSD
jgi:GR25 family glycosyltransferase involved in LPS biosynthesis